MKCRGINDKYCEELCTPIRSHHKREGYSNVIIIYKPESVTSFH